jgi:hypothetical protein
VRGLPGKIGAVGRGLTVGGFLIAGYALVQDLREDDYAMAGADALGTAGGAAEVYALAGGATIAGASALSVGLVLGGAGIAIGSGISGYRSYQQGDTAGVVAGIVGVAAGLAIVAGVVFGAPVLLAAGIVAAVAVGLFHLGRWLLSK